jgi:hypothetical protein
LSMRRGKEALARFDEAQSGIPWIHQENLRSFS